MNPTDSIVILRLARILIVVAYALVLVFKYSRTYKAAVLGVYLIASIGILILGGDWMDWAVAVLAGLMMIIFIIMAVLKIPETEEEENEHKI